MAWRIAATLGFALIFFGVQFFASGGVVTPMTVANTLIFAGTSLVIHTFFYLHERR